MIDYAVTSTKAEMFLAEYEKFSRSLKTIHTKTPLVFELIETFEREQRSLFERMLSEPSEYDPEHVSFATIDPNEFESLCRTLAELFIEKAAAEEMTPRIGSDVGKFFRDLMSGEVKRQFNRQEGAFRSIDIESQSLIYAFQRTARHTNKRRTLPKTMEVLKKIRKALAARWE